MNKYIILSEKKWHLALYDGLSKKFNNYTWILIDKKNNFNIESLRKINPIKIFIPHWSNIISNEIHENFECIVFHMTDLPFGRGGSPLQNLILLGYKKTILSAIQIDAGIDTGPVYLKKTLELEGTANDIFLKSSLVIEEMITEIINNNLKPTPQIGEVTEFRRRKPEESNIINLTDLSSIYDYIRMLDCDGYPNAFIESDYFKFEFTDAHYDDNDKLITANVRIIKK